MFKVAISAGHGYNTPGKRTPDGEREWAFNNEVVKAAIRELGKYQSVEVLRLDDPTGKTDVPLKTRTDRANAWEADVLVDVHHNAMTGRWGTHSGVETFTYEPVSSNPKSKALADKVHPKIVNIMGISNRGIKGANFHMVRESNMPAILTEGGFMDSTVDIKKMRDDMILAAQGVAIATGIAEYAGLKKKTVATKPVSKPIAEVSGKNSEDEVEKLELTKRQREEIANNFKTARERGVFSSAEHEKQIIEGKMTQSRLLYLNNLIATAALVGGERNK